MFKRRLGRSGIEVSALGLGCMEIGGAMKDSESFSKSKEQPLFFLGEVDDDTTVKAVRYAVDQGINFIDTAPAYGAGHSERILGRALKGRRHQVVVATKFGKRIDEEDNRFGRYENEEEVIRNVRKECEASLRRLGTDYIDLYQFHLGEFSQPGAEEIVNILESLVSEGKIRYYGWSTDSPDCAGIFVQGPHCTAIQMGLNVLSDNSADLLALCEKYDQAVIARGVLGNGFLTGKYTLENYKSLLSPDDFRLRGDFYYTHLLGKIDVIRDILTSNGRSPAQGALAWVWARNARTIPIPGFRNLTQVEQNIKSFEFGPLAPEQMLQIDRILGRKAE